MTAILLFPKKTPHFFIACPKERVKRGHPTEKDKHILGFLYSFHITTVRVNNKMENLNGKSKLK
ncbi:MAG: hypothetical protein KJ908_09340 [Acidobacteria bacterium]|nr:hypothetical protein [Acidobacteriota bacterium]MBU2438473.1 hypothetical protein [Acidobacteriota bacterium]